jgi:HEAT repeat protein
VKEKILFAVSQSNDTGSDRWLLDLAKNGNEPIELRKKALFWAGQSGSLKSKDLADLYESMPDPEMRKQLVFSLSQRNDAAAMDKLIDIARNEKDQDLRRSALFWIGQSKDPRATQLLQDILEKE